MLRYLLYFFLLFGFILSTTSCKKDKFKAPAASFLLVDKVSIKTTPAQGTNSHHVTDIWYYVDGKFQGVFPVGSVMPVIANSNAEIILMAGIKNNGISGTRTIYEFYNSIKFNLNAEAGKTYTVSPEFEYSGGALFHYPSPQDFDSTSSQFQSTGDSDYVRVTDPAKTFGGTGGSIFMSMSSAKPTSKMVQSLNYYLPGGGATVYLELNYKCNQTFMVGVIAGDVVDRPVLTVNKSDEWNKIYIPLTKAVSLQPVFQGFKVYIKAIKEVDTPEIYIDNIKLISQ